MLVQALVYYSFTLAALIASLDIFELQMVNILRDWKL